MKVFRHCDPRFPFLWEASSQPAGRWHVGGEGPVHYFADTPYGAWAELLRHEEIREPEDLAGLERAFWTVELADIPTVVPSLPGAVMTGDPETYPACRREAARLRRQGATGLRAPSAALEPGAARGWKVEQSLRQASAQDGEVFVLFGRRPDLVGWQIMAHGQPPPEVLDRVRHFSTVPLSGSANR